jgi:very-short-patch-repair endonuclease
MSEKKNNNTALKALENLRLRLLDLTARNRLINLRHTKGGTLRIIDELPDQLVEALLSEIEMRFLAVPEPTRDELIEAAYIDIDEETGQDVRLQKDPTALEWAKHLKLSTSYEVPQPSEDEPEDKHTDNAIQTLFYPYELEARLKKLQQTSELAIQEMGANILYIAFGFLEWFDNSNDNARIAPLFLLPVRLQKGRLNPKTKTYEYTLNYSGEDIIPNLSLKEKLFKDFAMALPGLDENTTPETYFNDVQKLIQDNQPRWRVRRFITMALLNFSKLLMYLDLDPSRWPEGANIVDHPVVKSFLSGCSTDQEGEDIANDDLGFGDEYLIDEIDDIHIKYPLIDDADSSQHSALIDAVDGKNLVIEGPPGTGKSQTITNLIAAAMAQGKRVLFVAEKLAALEVVRRRLDAAGLGEFCLELHSHKTQKRRALDEIELRLRKHSYYRKPKDIEVDIAFYEELKTTLMEHAERINRPWKNTGKTVHEIFMAATRYREAIGISPNKFHPERCDGDSFDVTTQRRTMDQVEAFRKIYQVVVGQLDGDAELHEHPWYGVCDSELQIFDLDSVKLALEEWQDSLKNLSGYRAQLAKGLSCKQDEIPESLRGLSSLLADLECLPPLQGDELLDQLPLLRGEMVDKAKLYLKLFEDIQSHYEILVQKVEPSILEDLSTVDVFLSARSQLSKFVTQKDIPGVGKVTLKSLFQAIRWMDILLKKFADWDEPLKEICAAVGGEGAGYLSAHEAGVNEFKIFVDLVADLNLSYLKFRDELFENPELDKLLPKLRAELEQLHLLKEELQGAFRIEDLPSNKELCQLQDILDAGGMFRWFKGNWRAARKKLLRYASNNLIKFSDLQLLLKNAAEFSESFSELNGNNNYKEALGDHLNGLDTNILALESLRRWYKKVRLQYGVMFGEKVTLGNAIINLQENLFRGLSSLSDRGLSQDIDSFLEILERIKAIFEPISLTHNDKVNLAGELGLINQVKERVSDALRICSPLLKEADDTISLSEIYERINALDLLREAEIKWERSDIDKKLFQGRVGLKTGVNVNNEVSLSKLRNTLTVVAFLERQVENSEIKRCIYSQPSTETFRSLSILSTHLHTAMGTQTTKFESFEQLVGMNKEDWMRCPGDQIDNLILRNGLALSCSDTLQHWLDYIRVRDQVAKMGLVKLAESAERGDIDIQQVEDAHKAGVFDVLAREILREQQELGRFSGHSQAAIQDKFKEYDNRLKKLQCELIAWKIDQTRIPTGNHGARVSTFTDRILLEHECTKKTRHIPIRQLVHRAGRALVALKPCFMMGPMSVAQYLMPGQFEFDLVVMDEASQIKPQDALGAIARAAQLVVVGDPKQLPPTSFFDRIVDDDEEDPTAIEESESILDATLPMFPARRLRWHYRSQHESLIAFSNQSFYDGDLVIFPSPNNADEGYGIKYSRIHRGCFVNRRNMEEAKVISEAVREHFRHRSEESLGVVAMNAEQRMQIERTLETLAKDDTVFQTWLEEDSTRQESLFIKNLENVQGDERDVIFVSMTYGPQEPGGKVFQRFGPINSDVGWRRLNVLFTRSKMRMHIFSSMGSEDIVAGSSAKRGVQALRDFLSFCETGILHKTVRETGREPDSDFEIAVMTALSRVGFECVPQVGVAGFFIDIAVVDPGNPGRFLMGIECDGATYHSAKSTRDRDRLRQTILERLGWKIRRIWSTDWFKNPHSELKPIIKELNELKSEMVEEYNDDILVSTSEFKQKPDQLDLYSLSSSFEDVSEENAIEKIIVEADEQEEIIEGFLIKGNGLTWSSKSGHFC